LRRRRRSPKAGQRRLVRRPQVRERNMGKTCL
jgi:hypothetical protein